MSDDEPRNVFLEPLAPELLTEFFQDRDVSVNCELCGKNNWTNLSQIESAIPIIQMVDFTNAEDGFTIAMVVVSCNHCGNMRNIRRSVIGKWLNEKKKED